MYVSGLAARRIGGCWVVLAWFACPYRDTGDRMQQLGKGIPQGFRR
jgi:hypothetical protein